MMDDKAKVRAIRMRQKGERQGDSRLIIFTRYPEPGKAKTRLIAALGSEGAAELHGKMTECTLNCASGLQREYPVSLEVRFDGGDEQDMKRWLGGGRSYRPQGRGDLGARMHRAFCEAFEEGIVRAVLIGTDCPGLTSDILKRAFGKLGREPIVLGPARDGGYYLIGLRQSMPSLFSNISWGTHEVLRQTVRAAEAHGVSVAFLDTLDDVDRVEDLTICLEGISK
jgi:rSAM/selenodomain-associated transferase 1